MIREAQANTTPWSYAPPASGIAATTTAVTVKAAETGKQLYITDIHLSHATLGNITEFCVRSAAGGTVLFRAQLNVTANDGTWISFKTPLVGAVSALLEIVTLQSATGGVFCNIQGFSA